METPQIPLPQFPSRPTCTLCTLHTFTPPGGHNGVPTTLHPTSLPPAPLTPSVVFVGMNPGREESLRNAPFVGPSGRIVRDAFIPGTSLHTLATIYFANIARCYSPVTPTGNTITNAHYKTCRPFLLPDLHLIPGRPLHLVALGADAARHLCALLNLGNSRSQAWAFSHQGIPFSSGPLCGRLWSTYHPAAILRNHNLILTSELHLNLLSSFLRGLTLAPSTPEVIPCRLPRAPSPTPRSDSPTTTSAHLQTSTPTDSPTPRAIPPSS